ncbi:hypothetical protein MMC13_002404 [Lambiella insularis]|nr:hypothetical protein [Lambiella insularis]
MWKRFNRSSESTIGNPTLVETTLDEKSYKGLTNLSNGEFSLSSRPAFGRKQTEDVVKELPALPLDNQTTPPLAPRPFSALPAVDSKILPLRPERPDKHPRLEIPRSSSVYPDDVSPPDSPRTIDAARSKKSSPNISPITDRGSTHNSAFVSSRPYVSSIPLPKNHGSIGRAGSVSGWREKVVRASTPTGSPTMTRWDDFSGEPTNSDTGKPAQATPGTAQFDKQLADRLANGDARSPRSSVEAGKIPFSTKLRKVSGHDTSDPPKEREEWKGASGRHTIVKQVADTPRTSGKGPAAAHFKGSLKHTMGLRARPTPGKMSPSRTSPTALRITDTKVQPQQEPQIDPVPESPERESHHTEPPILPIVPLKVRRSTPNAPVTQPPMEVITSGLNKSSPPTRKSSLETRVSHNKEPRSPPESPPQEEIPKTSENDIAVAAQNFSISNEPGSRFSATTYNTTIPESPPATPRRSLDYPPPLPTPPASISILNRKRPVPAAGVMLGNKPKPPTRKPTPSQAESDLSKSLPMSPPTTAAVDRVSLLQAQLDSLNRRRQNLQTVIHELTNVVQPSSIAYDIATRQEIKKTVEGLHAESAAVAKEIYETGMKLHRVMKRRDEDSVWEPTGLWVRRVTTE